MGRACGAECIVHALGNAGIVAEQDAGEQRGLRFGEDVRDDVLGMSLERKQPSEQRKTLIAREHRNTWARHDRVHILASEVLTIVKFTYVGGRLDASRALRESGRHSEKR
jgi:hypothetical protein